MDLTRDINSLTHFKRNTSQVIEQLKATGARAFRWNMPSRSSAANIRSRNTHEENAVIIQPPAVDDLEAA